jgi:hypothetical protein
MPGRFHDPEDGQAPRDHLIIVAKPIAADHGDTQGNGFAIGWTTGSKRAGCGQRQFQVWRSVAYFIFRGGKFGVGYRAVGEAPCERAPAHSMLAKNSRVYAGDFPSAYKWHKGKTSCSNS